MIRVSRKTTLAKGQRNMLQLTNTKFYAYYYYFQGFTDKT